MDAALASLRNQGMGDPASPGGYAAAGDLEIIIQDGDVEPDRGQSDALNRGFAKAKGEWLFWLNADDLLLPGALQKVKTIIHSSTTTSDFDSLQWIAGNQICIDEQGRVLKCMRANAWHDGLYRHAVPHVNGPSAFFRRELFEKVGGFDTSLHICMDWDMWIRFMKLGTRFYRIDDYLWAMRFWSGSKTQGNSRAADWHREEVARMLAKNEFDITYGGVFKMRLWRMIDGAYLRGWIDTLIYKGQAVGRM